MEELDRLRLPLSALMQWFLGEGLRAAIIGGVAASLRGKPRLTKDIDAVVVDADPERLLRSCEQFDFVARIDDAIEFAQESRMLLLRYGPAPIDVDVSLGALPFEQEVIERSTWVDIGGLNIVVASAEDVVIMKAVARRARDVMDIENLIEANPDLDVERIRRWVREFASVLEMPEIHDDLEKLLRRRQR